MKKTILFSALLLAVAFSANAQTGGSATSANNNKLSEQALRDRINRGPQPANTGGKQGYHIDASQQERDKRVYNGDNKAPKPTYTAPDNQYNSNRDPVTPSKPSQYNTGNNRAQ